MTIQTPDWVKHSVFYQIFPDRFARSSRTPHARGLRFKTWGSPPDQQGFQGGCLRGVVDKLDYLQELGVNAIYLNPIFSSAANHRYHPFDYFQVDPLLGGDQALRELLDEAHKRRMRIVLDGVFNHASRGFWPFHHVLENGRDSPYLDWFKVRDWPLRPYHSDEQHHPNYEAWRDLPMLPKLNTDNPGVRDYILDVARYWIEFGIDGWRLDVPGDIDDDDFWREFRRIVKTANPDAYICGEIWEEAQRWLAGDQFDAVMNYLFSWSTMSFFGAETLRRDYEREHFTLDPLDPASFAKHIDYMHGLYDQAINQAQLNLLDSHDTARALWIMGEDKGALRLCALFQMTMPGAPCIYYGDEIGLSAADDPDCRGAFPWEAEASWDTELLAFYREATALRHRFPVLRTGSFQTLHAAGDVYVFGRHLGQSHAVVLFNRAGIAADVSIKLSCKSWRGVEQAWPQGGHYRHTIADGRLEATVPARDALVLIGENSAGDPM